MKQRRLKSARLSKAASAIWNLYLYVDPRTPASATAFRNLKQICDAYLAGRYHIEVVDLMKNPRIAREEQIIALPTLVRKMPTPIRKIVGDLSNTASALAGLDLQPDCAVLQPGAANLV